MVHVPCQRALATVTAACMVGSELTLRWDFEPLPLHCTNWRSGAPESAACHSARSPSIQRARVQHPESPLSGPPSRVGATARYNIEQSGAPLCRGPAQFAAKLVQSRASAWRRDSEFGRLSP
jgi:hypothetical protein